MNISVHTYRQLKISLNNPTLAVVTRYNTTLTRITLIQVEASHSPEVYEYEWYRGLCAQYFGMFCIKSCSEEYRDIYLLLHFSRCQLRVTYMSTPPLF